MNMKKLFIWILVLVVVVGGGFYLVNIYQGEKQSDRDEVTTYFRDQMIDLAVKDIGMAIEGFDPQLLIIAYPGLMPRDFQGVESLEGKYVVGGEEIKFVRTESQPITSAERMVSEEGYKTLLNNVSLRLSVSKETKEDIDNLIEKINTADRVKTKISEGASAFGLALTPRELMEDSRCPVDVQCIQAGTVRVRADVVSPTGNGSKIFDFEKPVIVDKWEITLVQVDPVPEAGKEIGDSDYTFYFRISTRVN